MKRFLKCMKTNKTTCQTYLRKTNEIDNESKQSKNLSNKLIVRYSGEIRDYGNGNNNYADVILDDYITFDYSAKYRLYNTYDLFFSAKNLFDQNYEKAWMYSTMRRSFNFGIRRVY